MAARAISTLYVSFGLVSIPVKLYSAIETSTGISFNLLHEKCGSRLRQQYLCIAEDVVVERDEMIKGYEFTPDRYVTFTKEELKLLEEKPTPTVDIAEFVPVSVVDPVYYDKPYYLAPDKGGEKPYALLVEAMHRTGRSALARYAARGKQYLVQLRPVGKALVMQQLHYADEVRTVEDIPVRTVDVREQELLLATQLIEQISSDVFNPEAYRDEVKVRLEEAIQKKVEGEVITAPPEEKPPVKVIDLMAALKASIEAKQTEPRKPAKRAPGRATIARGKTSKKS